MWMYLQKSWRGKSVGGAIKHYIRLNIREDKGVQWRKEITLPESSGTYWLFFNEPLSMGIEKEDYKTCSVAKASLIVREHPVPSWGVALGPVIRSRSWRNSIFFWEMVFNEVLSRRFNIFWISYLELLRPSGPCRDFGPSVFTTLFLLLEFATLVWYLLVHQTKSSWITRGSC